MNKIQKIIRYVLTLLIIYGAYTETGMWTALSLFLIFMGMEINGYLIGKVIRKLK